MLHNGYSQWNNLYFLIIIFNCFAFSELLSDKNNIQFLSLFGDDDKKINNFIPSENLAILQFDDEQSFMDRFKDDPEFEGMFNKTSKRNNFEFLIPGDLGYPVEIENPSVDVAIKIKEGFKSYGYNKYVSD